jgi:hypothetical protein
VTIVRLALAAAFLALLAAWPVLQPDGSLANRGVGVVSAAPAADSRHPEKEEKNRNENWNGNTNGNGNGNGNSNGNDNSNDVDDGDDEPSGGRGVDRGGLPPAMPPAPASSADRCFAVGQPGALSLTLDGGTVTLSVVPGSAFPKAGHVALARVDAAAVPATPGPRLDAIVFEIRAQDGCDGGMLAELPADANLGVSYRVPAEQVEKASLRYAILDGGRWVDVPTTPDPSTPYVSATVRRAGIYTVYQAR